MARLQEPNQQARTSLLAILRYADEHQGQALPSRPDQLLPRQNQRVISAPIARNHLQARSIN